MKTIETRELVVNDVFTHELKPYGRERFLVIGVTENHILCKSRNSGKEMKKKRDGNVVLLRHIDD